MRKCNKKIVAHLAGRQVIVSVDKSVSESGRPWGPAGITRNAARPTKSVIPKPHSEHFFYLFTRGDDTFFFAIRFRAKKNSAVGDFLIKTDLGFLIMTKKHVCCEQILIDRASWVNIFSKNSIGLIFQRMKLYQFFARGIINKIASARGASR